MRPSLVWLALMGICGLAVATAEPSSFAKEAAKFDVTTTTCTTGYNPCKSNEYCCTQVGGCGSCRYYTCCSRSSVNVGAIVGGAIGGFFAILIFLFIFRWSCRRRARRTTTTIVTHEISNRSDYQPPQPQAAPPAQAGIPVYAYQPMHQPVSPNPYHAPYQAPYQPQYHAPAPVSPNGSNPAPAPGGYIYGPPPTSPHPHPHDPASPYGGQYPVYAPNPQYAPQPYGYQPQSQV